MEDDLNLKHITDLKNTICCNFLSLKTLGEHDVKFDKTLLTFIDDIQVGTWLENSYYKRFSKELGSLLAYLLEPCLKGTYVIENISDGNFKLTICFENLQNQYKEFVIIYNDSIQAKFWPEQFETLFQTNAGSINLCRWYSYLEPFKISDYFWSILVMQECKLFLYDFVLELDLKGNTSIACTIQYSRTYQNPISLEDFISSWCMEIKRPSLDNSELGKIDKNLFHEDIPVKVMIEYFSSLTIEKNYTNEPYLTTNQLVAFIKRVCSGETSILKININFNPNKETSIIRTFFWGFYNYCVEEYEVSSTERGKFINLLCDNFNNFNYETTLENFNKKSKIVLPNPLKIKK